MDIGAFVAYLAPLLPQLIGLPGEDGEAHGPARWIWDRLRGRVAERPAAQEAVDDVADNPEDEVNRTVLFAQLRKIFEQDPALAAEIEHMFAEAQASGAGTVTTVNVSGARAVGIGGNMSGGSIVTGGQ